MSSDPLPPRPSLDQLRRRAKELRDAARSGEPAALGRITACTPAARPGRVTLAAAQLAIAREHGYPSWPQLVAEVQARTAELGQRVDEFLVASIRDWTGRAARMLARDPWLAGYDFGTAVVLGDAARVRAMLARDPGLATRPDARTGWTALHAACASRWHRLDPARAGGLTEVARLLLDAGADPAATAPPFARPDEPGRHWSPLLCAVAGAPNPGITRLLLEHGARPDDHVLYLAAFDSDHECLRLVLPYAPDIIATTALSAPISTGDVTGARLLLDAGADPNHPLDAGLLGESHEQSPPVPPLSAAIELQAGPELTGLLLEYGAAPDVPGWDGRTPYQQAVRTGQGQVAELLARHGASTALSSADEFLAACRRADRAAATAALAATPDLAARLIAEDHRILADAAGHGHTEAVRLMLDLGFPPGTRSGQDDGATALHLAAAAGSTSTVRLLLARGADIEARDTTWDSTPLEWAIVGSGMRLGHDQHPDWPATVCALLDAGASTAGIVLSPDDPKPPSPEVAALLRARGIPGEASDVAEDLPGRRLRPGVSVESVVDGLTGFPAPARCNSLSYLIPGPIPCWLPSSPPPERCGVHVQDPTDYRMAAAGRSRGAGPITVATDAPAVARAAAVPPGAGPGRSAQAADHAAGRGRRRGMPRVRIRDLAPVRVAALLLLRTDTYQTVVTALRCLDLHAAARLILRNRPRKLSRPQPSA